MATFALVHGAWHGPWSWERVAGPLADHGHEVVVPDLPSEDVELGLDDYADTIDRALGAADDVVLVPHSLGGLVGGIIAIPIAALIGVGIRGVILPLRRRAEAREHARREAYVAAHRAAQAAAAANEAT